MKPLRIPLRAVLYREDSVWIAHCLELDLLGDGETQADAVKLMCEAIAAQIDACVKYNSSHAFFSPAEGKFFEMFAAGKNLAIGELVLPLTNLPIDSFEIEQVEAREYDPCGTVESEAELVGTP